MFSLTQSTIVKELEDYIMHLFDNDEACRKSLTRSLRPKIEAISLENNTVAIETAYGFTVRISFTIEK